MNSNSFTLKIFTLDSFDYKRCRNQITCSFAQVEFYIIFKTFLVDYKSDFKNF